MARIHALHESPPFATPDAKSCFYFPSLWQSKRKKPNFFAKNDSGKTLAEVTEMLYSLGEISGTHIFINGIKIESVANRYTFVWKKAVTKHQQSLCGRMRDTVWDTAEDEPEYPGWSFV